MIRCQNCGQNNSDNSNFCRFCGSKFQPSQPKTADVYQQNQPRPYAWKTDEYQIEENSARPTQMIDQPQTNPIQAQINQGQMLNQYGQPNTQIQPQYQNTLSTGYHCPFCHANVLPLTVKKVSPTGWAVFTVLLITTFILFWIGLLIQEERKICPNCNMRVG